MVPGAGVEPARCFHRGILSPLRLPISPPGRRVACNFYAFLNIMVVRRTTAYHNATPALLSGLHCEIAY
jgi:hypothetical protein